MAATGNWFDRYARSKNWFHHQMDGAAWFDQDLVEITTGGATPIAGADSVGVAISEDRTQFVQLTREEALMMALSDVSRVLARLSQEDTVVVRLTDTAVLEVELNLVDTLAIGLTEDRTVLAKLTRDDLLLLGLLEDRTIFALLSTGDTPAILTTEQTALLAMLVREDFLPYTVADLSTIAIAVSGADSVSTVISELSQAIVNIPASDGLVIGLSEDRTIFVRVTRDEALMLGLSDSVTILATVTTEDAPALVIVDTSSLDIFEGATVFKEASESLTLGLVDSYLSLLARLSTDDTLTLAWEESVDILARLTREDTIAIGTAETSQLAVAISTTGDALKIGLAEDRSVHVSVAGEEAVSAVLTETSRIFARLAVEDGMVVGLDDAIQRLLATLTTADVPAVVVIEAGPIQVPITAADSVVVRLTDSGQVIEVFLNRLGSVLVATVRQLGTTEWSLRYLERVVRAPSITIRTLVYLLKTVRYLGTILTLRVL